MAITVVTERQEILRNIIKRGELSSDPKTREDQVKVIRSVIGAIEDSYSAFMKSAQRDVKAAHDALEEYTGATLEEVEGLLQDPIGYDEKYFEFKDRTPNFRIHAHIKFLVKSINSVLKESQVNLFSFQVQTRILALYLEDLELQNTSLKSENVKLMEKIALLEKDLDDARRQPEPTAPPEVDP